MTVEEFSAYAEQVAKESAEARAQLKARIRAGDVAGAMEAFDVYAKLCRDVFSGDHSKND